MRNKNNKALYESIMRKVSKVVRKALSEHSELSESVTVTMPTLIRKINKELDRLYDTHIVNATDDIVMRPLGYPVSYDPMYNILTVDVNDDIRLKRSKGSVEIFDDSIGRYGKYKMLKHENIEFVNDVYMKLRDMK